MPRYRLKDIDISEIAMGLIMAFSLLLVFGVLTLLGFGLVSIVLLGLLLVFYGWRRRRFAEKTLSWPVAEAEIELAEVRDKLVADGEHNGPSRYFYPYVQYTYTVKGHQYTGHDLGLYRKEYWFDREDDARAELERITGQRSLQVHFNPRDPGWGLLEPGISKKQKMHFLTIQIGGVLILAMGVIVSWMAYHTSA